MILQQQPPPEEMFGQGNYADDGQNKRPLPDGAPELLFKDDPNEGLDEIFAQGNYAGSEDDGRPLPDGAPEMLSQGAEGEPQEEELNQEKGEPELVEKDDQAAATQE